MSQAGVQGVVTALHHIPNGAIWPISEIENRKTEISRLSNGRSSNLAWDVVESLPVSEDVKRQSGEWREHIANYKQSIQHLAECGVNTICYNFMPILDWTRTDLRFELHNGSRCMRFDIVDFAVFDIHLLKRSGSGDEYSQEVIAAAEQRFASMSDSECKQLVSNIVCGLPGSEQGYTLDNIKGQLALYDRVSDQTLRQNQIDFLSEVVPVAEKAGVRLCCHPDDPPFGLLGLPRIMSTEKDYHALTQTIDSNANGITLCSGSLGVRHDNDLPGMMKRLGSYVHFVHLRNIYCETNDAKNSFYESAHLEGSVDMVALVKAIVAEEKRRKSTAREDCSIPFRPDHGQEILSDLGTTQQPGYPAVGRLKGLAELRGIIAALTQHTES